MDKFIYFGLIFAQLLTLVAYTVVTFGAAFMQNIFDTEIRNVLMAGDSAGFQAAVTDVLQSANIIPYMSKANTLPFSLQYQWWIIEMELLIFLLTAMLTVMPKFIARGKPVALALLSAALPLVMDNMNSLAFLSRNDAAIGIFSGERINLTYAGLILVFCANILTIIFMGLYQTPAPKAPVTVAANSA